MTKKQKKSLISAIRKNRLLDWGYGEVANQLDPDDLRSIIRELGYAIYIASESGETRACAEAIKSVQENILV